MSENTKKTLDYELQIPHSEQEEVFDENGVDLTLIRWMLSLTPLERLEFLQDNINAIALLRGEG